MKVKLTFEFMDGANCASEQEVIINVDDSDFPKHNWVWIKAREVKE